VITWSTVLTSYHRLKVDENAKIDNRQVSGYLYQMLNYADGQSLLAIIEKKMEIKKTGDPDMIFAALMRGEDTPEIVKIRPDTGAGAELFVMLKQQERGYEMLKSANSVSLNPSQHLCDLCVISN